MPAAVAYNTEVEKNFLKTTFEIRAIAEETVGCGVDLMQDAGRRRRRSPEPRRRRRGAQAAGAAPARRAARVPPPPPAARPVPALRRPHRRRQGLRGAARILHQLQGTGRRRAAGADGRQADADARGAVGEFRRPALGARAPAGARSGDHRRRAVAVREPVAAGARSHGGRHAGALQRAREVLVEHCLKSNAGLFYADRDEFIECAKLLLADERLRARWAATARNTSSGTTAGT